MLAVRSVGNGQLNHFLYHTTCHGGVINAVDVLRLLVEFRIEVHLNRSGAIERHFVTQTANVQVVER